MRVDITQWTLQASSVGKIVGIDLGTTNSAIAIVEAGMPGLLADSDGRRLVPSVVHYPIGGEPVTGYAAQSILTVEPKRTVYSIKRFIGSRLQDLSELDLNVGFQIGGVGQWHVAAADAGHRRVEIIEGALHHHG